MNFVSKLIGESPELLLLAVIIGVISSFVTLFLNRFFDLFQTKKEQRYKLQSTFFEKKLNAAEAAVIQWSDVASACTSLSILYQRMKENEEFNPDLFEELNENLHQQMRTAIDSSEAISSSILLYFDVEEELWQHEKPIEDLYESLSKILDLSQENTEIDERLEHIKDEELIRELEKEQERMRNQARAELEKLSSVYNKAKKQMFNAIRTIRGEMKKFDVR